MNQNGFELRLKSFLSGEQKEWSDGFIRPLIEHLISQSENSEERAEITRFFYDETTEGIRRVAAERRRQIEEEGWSLKHDDNHLRGELSDVAACYTIHAGRLSGLPSLWPRSWNPSWWKPTTRIRDLEKAGALIVAEIDRLLREEERHEPQW